MHVFDLSVCLCVCTYEGRSINKLQNDIFWLIFENTKNPKYVLQEINFFIHTEIFMTMTSLLTLVRACQRRHSLTGWLLNSRDWWRLPYLSPACTGKAVRKYANVMLMSAASGHGGAYCVCHWAATVCASVPFLLLPTRLFCACL